MRVVWHIVRKDFFRLRWILLLWVVVLVGGLGLATIQSGLDHLFYFPFHVAAKVVLSGFTPLLAFGVVMGLLHDDSVAEIDAFWITRPIASGELLAAKALAWLLLGLIPVGVMLPFWLSHDYGAGLIVAAIFQTAQLHGIVLVLALPFAVVSANGSKFVMHVMLGAAGVLLLTLLYRLGASSQDSLAPGLIHSRAWLIAVLWLVATVVVTVNQFWWRRTRRSWLVLAATATLAFGMAKWWPVNFPFLTREPASPTLAAHEQPAADAPFFAARIDGQMKRLVVVAEVPLRERASTSQHGVTLKVQTVFLDLTGLLQVAFSGTTPCVAQGWRDLLPGAIETPEPPAHYLIINRSVGGMIAVTSVRNGFALDVAAMRTVHRTIETRPAGAWQNDARPDVNAWLKGAVLLKAVVDEADVLPRATAAQFSP